MSSAIILGDIHLGKSEVIGKMMAGSKLNSRVADQLYLLDWTLEQAIESGSTEIILTGDIWEDPKPQIHLITNFVSWLKLCSANNINVHIIYGNHDILRTGNIYTSPLDIISELELNNVYVYKDINTIIIGRSAFTFMPFRDRKSFFVNSNSEAIKILQDSLIYELASIPKTYNKIIVGHLAIEGSIPIGDEIDDIANELLCPISMFNGYDYVWMGHVHNPQIMNKSKPYIAHIGSMDISNFGETDHKKIIVNIDCNKYDDIYKTIKIPTRNLKKISISIPKDIQNSTEYVLNEIKKEKNIENSIVKVEISLSDPDLKSVNKQEIEKFLVDNGVFNVSSISESKKLLIIKKDSENNINTKLDVITAIKKYSEKYIKEESRDKFIELSLDIYNNYKLESKD